jgi:hypothetical protein
MHIADEEAEAVSRTPNKPNASKPATTSRLHITGQWRGLADSERYASAECCQGTEEFLPDCG